MWKPFKRSREPAPPKERRPSRFGRRAYDPGEGARREPQLAAAGIGALPPPPDHSASRAADPYAFEVAHTRLAWTARLLAFGFASSVSLNLVLGGAISYMAPLKTVEPALVRVEPTTNRTVPVDPASRVRVLPITKDAEGFDLVMEAFVRRYVRMLLEIDPVSHQDRLTEANRFSDTDFWKSFIKEKYPDIKAAMTSGMIRSVVVQSAERISERQGVYRYLVAFDQIDEREGKVVETKKLHAYLAVTARPHTVRESEKYENPLGLRVLHLSIKVRGN